MNWANRLTLSRLALTVLFVVLLSSSWNYARTAALVIFLIAGLTDFIDGEIARRYGVITNFGKLMDPLVDKIMVAAAFISLVPLKAVPAWAATTVVAAHAGTAFNGTSEMNAAATMILSTSGSINLPKSVTIP